MQRTWLDRIVDRQDVSPEMFESHPPWPTSEPSGASAGIPVISREFECDELALSALPRHNHELTLGSRGFHQAMCLGQLLELEDPVGGKLEPTRRDVIDNLL